DTPDRGMADHVFQLLDVEGLDPSLRRGQAADPVERRRGPSCDDPGLDGDAELAAGDAGDEGGGAGCSCNSAGGAAARRARRDGGDLEDRRQHRGAAEDAADAVEDAADGVEDRLPEAAEEA